MNEKYKYIPGVILAGSSIFSSCSGGFVDESPSPNYPSVNHVSISEPPESPVIDGYRIKVSDCTNIQTLDPLNRSTSYKGFILNEVEEVEEFYEMKYGKKFMFPMTWESRYVSGLSDEVRKDGYRTVINERRAMFELSYELPSQLKENMWLALKPINDLLKKEDKIIDVNLYPLKGTEDYEFNAHPYVSQERKNSIMFVMKRGVEIYEKELEMVAFHEGMHVLFNYGYVKSDEKKMYEFLPVYQKMHLERQSLLAQEKINIDMNAGVDYDPSRQFEQKVRTGRIKMMGDLFNIVTEGCYGRHERGGHPQDNISEMVVSTATVMKYFPKSFEQAVGKLDSEDRDTILKLSRQTIDTMITYSGNYDGVVGMYDERILSLLGLTKLQSEWVGH